MSDTEIFERLESNVRSYCRSFPTVFDKAQGSLMYAADGTRYIDFLAGAGALNYGHNEPSIKRKLIDYLDSDSITHGLDLYTVAKRDFLGAMDRHVLAPNDYVYKMQFCGPTGANAVEAALKIARKATGRTGIFSFMGGYHGMSLGSLSATGNRYHRGGSGIPLQGVSFMPYPHGFMRTFDSIDYIEAVLEDESSGIDKPAAMIFETIQAEGGVIVADNAWIRRLAGLCKRHDILLICDDVQVGCGRTGPFLSFERAGITPDIVVLSKSISGYGLPLAVVLLTPALDLWMPAEHNGTFRGNQLAFVAGTAALEYWKRENVRAEVERKGEFVQKFLDERIQQIHPHIKIRGMGLIWGIDLTDAGDPNAVVAECFERGLVIESAGRKGRVVKLLPALNIPMELLEEGCVILGDAIQKTMIQGATGTASK